MSRIESVNDSKKRMILKFKEDYLSHEFCISTQEESWESINKGSVLSNRRSEMNIGNLDENPHRCEESNDHVVPTLSDHKRALKKR